MNYSQFYEVANDTELGEVAASAKTTVSYLRKLTYVDYCSPFMAISLEEAIAKISLSHSVIEPVDMSSFVRPEKLDEYTALKIGRAS